MTPAIDENSTTKSSGRSFSSDSRTSSPFTFGTITASATSRVFTWTAPSPATPAPWKTPCSTPKRSIAWSTTSRIRCGLLASAPTTSTSAPCARSRFDAADAAARAVFLAVDGDVFGPRRFRRQPGPLHEHELRLVRAREVVGDGEADAARAARDEIHAAVAQPRLFVARRLGDRHRLVGFRPAMAAAIGDDRLARRRRHFGEDLGDRRALVRRLRLGHRRVDVDARQLGVLLRNHAARAEERRALGRDDVFAGHVLQAVGDDADVDGVRERAVAERLRDGEERVETAVLAPIESGQAFGRAAVRHEIPQRQDPARQPSVALELTDERGPMLAVAGFDDGVRVVQPAEPRVGADRDHLVAETLQRADHGARERRVVDQHQPARLARSSRLRRIRRGRDAPLPRRRVEPVGQRRALHGGGLGLQRLRREADTGEPVALALERIGGQRHAAAALAGVERAQSTSTPASQSCPSVQEQVIEVRRALVRGAQRVARRAAFGGRMLPHEARSACGPGRPRGAPRRRRPAASPTPSAKRTGCRRCCAQYAGSVACAAVIQVPVTFETKRHARRRARHARRRPRRSGRGSASIIAEWNAWRRRARGAPRWPPDASAASSARDRRGRARRRRVADGALTAAIDSSASSSGATSASGSGTASIAPGGSACISAPRAATSCRASSSEKTPARQRRHVLADAVAEHRRRRDAPRHATARRARTRRRRARAASLRSAAAARSRRPRSPGAG